MVADIYFSTSDVEIALGDLGSLSRRLKDCYGNENREFDEHRLNRVRHACINDLPIAESDRKFHWRWAGGRTIIRA